jgi:hypothetical protein
MGRPDITYSARNMVAAVGDFMTGKRRHIDKMVLIMDVKI